MSQVCPHCGKPLEVIVRQSGGKSTFLGRRQYRQHSRTRYHSEVEALAPQPLAPPELGAGETVIRETPMRAQNLESDVLVPAAQAALYGVGVTLIAIPATAILKSIPWRGPWVLAWLWRVCRALPWHTPAWIFLMALGAALFITSGQARKLLMLFEEWTNTDIDQDGQIGTKPEPEPIPIEHRRDKDGRAHRQMDAIPGVKAGQRRLAEWFRCVVRSDGEGFSIRVAKSYNITPAEVSKIQQWFLLHQPPLASRAGNNWIRPTEDGLDTMWAVVKRHFPDARLPLDRVEIVQNTGNTTDTQTQTQEE